MIRIRSDWPRNCDNVQLLQTRVTMYVVAEGQSKSGSRQTYIIVLEDVFVGRVFEVRNGSHFDLIHAKDNKCCNTMHWLTNINQNVISRVETNHSPFVIFIRPHKATL